MIRIVRDLCRRSSLLSSRLSHYADTRRAQRKIQEFSPPHRVHLGCGKVRFPGWINIDIDTNNPVADVVWDIAKGLPFQDGICCLIHCEHVLEHLKVEDGLFLLRECHRVLQKDGVMRLAMPSLDVLIRKSYEGNWRDQEWLTWPEHQFVQTRAEMLNICFRWWGHQWLYDREELHRRLKEAGFENIKDVEWGMSELPELRNKETRRDSLLICEVQK